MVDVEDAVAAVVAYVVVSTWPSDTVTVAVTVTTPEAAKVAELPEEAVAVVFPVAAAWN